MPFGYTGQNLPNQTVANSGVFSISEVADLEKQGKFGGSLEFIEEKSISGVSSAIFTDIKEAKYDVHYLQIIDYQPATDNTDIRIRFFESGVEESASVYQYAYQYGTVSGSFNTVTSTGADHIRASFNTGNTTNEKSNTYTYFYNLGNANKYSFSTHQGMTESTTIYMFFGGGVLPQTSTVNQIKLFNASGNFSCTAKLYGVKQI